MILLGASLSADGWATHGAIPYVGGTELTPGRWLIFTDVDSQPR